jgi:hypothetical protein
MAATMAFSGGRNLAHFRAQTYPKEAGIKPR